MGTKARCFHRVTHGIPTRHPWVRWSLALPDSLTVVPRAPFLLGQSWHGRVVVVAVVDEHYGRLLVVHMEIDGEEMVVG